MLDLFADASFERFWCCRPQDIVGATVFGCLLTRLLRQIDEVLPNNGERLYQQYEGHELAKAPEVFIRSKKWLVLFAWNGYLDCAKYQTQTRDPDGCRERGKRFEDGEVGHPDSDNDTVKQQPTESL